jgi:hypothetical protein
VVLAWCGPGQCEPGRTRLRLAGLDDGARYADPAAGTAHWGAGLARDGLELPAGPSDFGSALVRLIRQDG